MTIISSTFFFFFSEGLPRPRQSVSPNTGIVRPRGQGVAQSYQSNYWSWANLNRRICAPQFVKEWIEDNWKSIVTYNTAPPLFAKWLFMLNRQLHELFSKYNLFCISLFYSFYLQIAFLWIETVYFIRCCYTYIDMTIFIIRSL